MTQSVSEQAIDREFLKAQLDKLYTGIDNTFDYRQTVKSWCLTVWLAVLFALFSNKISVSIPFDRLLVVVPVLLFWFHEGIIAHDAILLHGRARKLEALLLGKGKLP